MKVHRAIFARMDENRIVSITKSNQKITTEARIAFFVDSKKNSTARMKENKEKFSTVLKKWNLEIFFAPCKKLKIYYHYDYIENSLNEIGYDFVTTNRSCGWENHITGNVLIQGYV